MESNERLGPAGWRAYLRVGADRRRREEFAERHPALHLAGCVAAGALLAAAVYLAIALAACLWG